jgi:hypothetical protein
MYFYNNYLDIDYSNEQLIPYYMNDYKKVTKNRWFNKYCVGDYRVVELSYKNIAIT